MSLVDYERRGSTAWLRLDRPEKLNALSTQLVEDLGVALRRAEEDDEVRVVVLTGAGRAFSAGYDLGEEAGTGARTAEQWHAALSADVGVTMQLWG